MQRTDAHNRLKAVRDELETARFAIRYALETWDIAGGAADSAGKSGISKRDLIQLLREIEATFIIRLVAAFEGILKDFREKGLNKRPARVDLEPLMKSMAGKRAIDDDTQREAHDVRNYRNDVVHRNRRTPLLDFAFCLRALNTFVAYLPPAW